MNLIALLGSLTGAFLISVLAVEVLNDRSIRVRIAWIGLFAVGIPWGCLFSAGLTNNGFFIALIPVLYFLVGFRWYKKFRKIREEEDRTMAESGGWRCRSCRTANAGINAVCHQCDSPREDPA